jgi:hypothetical protein
LTVKDDKEIPLKSRISFVARVVVNDIRRLMAALRLPFRTISLLGGRCHGRKPPPVGLIMIRRSRYCCVDELLVLENAFFLFLNLENKETIVSG